VWLYGGLCDYRVSSLELYNYLNYVTKKQNLRKSMGRLSIKNLVKPWALGRVQKKSVENSTLGWVGVSGVGQNPQNQV